jgi:hypothetical protein
MGNTPFDLHCPVYRAMFASFRNLPIGASREAALHELARTGRFKKRSGTFRGDVHRALSVGSFEVTCSCGRTFWSYHRDVLSLAGPPITRCPVHEPAIEWCWVCVAADST